MWGAVPVSYAATLDDPGVMPRHAAKLGVALRGIFGPTHRLDEGLLVCHACGSDFVNPVSWHEQGEANWWIRLRCGGCGFVREVEASNDEAERYDAELHRGIAKIAATLASLDRARMLAEADTLRIAFERDLIGPGDFRP
jgi:hypothetical protein